MAKQKKLDELKNDYGYLSIPKESHAKLKQLADADRRSLSNMAAVLIDRAYVAVYGLNNVTPLGHPRTSGE